jgi:cytochrome c553
MKKWLFTASISMMLATAGLQAAGDAAAGKAKSIPCMACHGADGNSVTPIWPKLAGQHENYIAKQLNDFRADHRVDGMMTPQAKLLETDQDVADLAAYFSAQKQTGGAASPAKVKLGAKIYLGGNSVTGVAACVACHGPKGVGNPAANFPRISGQHAAYVDKALKDFRDGKRTNDDQSMMQGVASNMSDEEIAAVAEYIQGLH